MHNKSRFIAIAIATLFIAGCGGGGSSSPGGDTNQPGGNNPGGTPGVTQPAPDGSGLNGAKTVLGTLTSPDGSVVAGATVYVPGGTGSAMVTKEESPLGLVCADPTELSCASTCSEADGTFTLDVTGCDAGITTIIIQKDTVRITITLNCTGENSCELGPITFDYESPGEGEDYTVGGSVAGLDDGDELVLQNNDTDSLSITANGEFVFPSEIANGKDYKVTVLISPDLKTCTVSGGAGTISSVNVANVNITCSTDAYTVGGTVSGLSAGEQIVLQNNGGDDLAISANSDFNFPSEVADGSSYSVTVHESPPVKNCILNNGTGIVSGANVVSVSVVCLSRSGTQWAGTIPDLALKNVGGYFHQVSVGPDGSAYAVGSIEGAGVFDFGNGITLIGCNKVKNFVIVKYNSAGVAQWAKSVMRDPELCAPNLLFGASTFYGVSVGADGSIYAVGFINAGGFDFGNGVIASGAYDGSVVIVKYDSAGVAQWAKSVTVASNWSYYHQVSVGPDGSVYVAGQIWGTGVVNFGNGVTAQGTNGGSVPGNAVLVKYNSAGVAQWAKTIANGSSQAAFTGVSVSADDSIYVLGCISTAYYLFKYNSAGVVQWTRGLAAGFGRVSVGPDGSVFVVGSINAGAYNFGNGVIVTSPVDSSVVIVKYDSAGVAQWAKSVTTGPDSSTYYAVSVGPDGSVFAVGNITGTNTYNFGNGVTVTGVSSDTNAVVVKYSSAGVTQWVKTAKSAAGLSYFSGVSVGPDGGAYVAGYVRGLNAFDFGSGVTISGARLFYKPVIVKFFGGDNAFDFTIGGSVAGLVGTLVLRDGFGDDLTLTSSGVFTFPVLHAVDGAAYAVTIKTQPAEQTCVVSNGSGTISGGNVTSVMVDCSNNFDPNGYTIGGKMDALLNSSRLLVLDVVNVANGHIMASRTFNGSGDFTFNQNFAYGTSYEVEVKSTPPNYSCEVTNARGTIGFGGIKHITNVRVVCVNYPDGPSG